jgi:hypothetical protein
MSISLIDIPSSVTTKCSLQCNYWFDYKDCPRVKVGTAANYFKINYDGAGSNIMYNSVVYKIASSNAISICVGGIHRFGSPAARPPLEMVIKHESQGTNSELYVCIPITTSGNMNSNNPLETILTTYYPSKSNPIIYTPNFNLNYIIPKSTYMVHTGAYHGQSKANSIYIVFPINSFKMSDQAIQFLTQSMSPYTALRARNVTLIQNEKGTTVNGFSGDGQIYIDCQPTDSEGEIVVKETIIPAQYYKFNMSIIIYILVVVISCILLIVLYQKIKDFFSFKNI